MRFGSLLFQLGVIEQQTVTDRRTNRETHRQRGCFVQIIILECCLGPAAAGASELARVIIIIIIIIIIIVISLLKPCTCQTHVLRPT